MASNSIKVLAKRVGIDLNPVQKAIIYRKRLNMTQAEFYDNDGCGIVRIGYIGKKTEQLAFKMGHKFFPEVNILGKNFPLIQKIYLANTRMNHYQVIASLNPADFELLVCIRLALGLTQSHVARGCKVSRNTINKFENDRGDIGHKNFDRVGKLYEKFILKTIELNGF